MTEDTPVLDPRQLQRIEALHRGFLYQHLYAVGCLLLAAEARATSVLVERDEDIEVALGDRHIYVQVKTRSSPLTQDDIKDSLARFVAIRNAHESRSRTGSAAFWIISNVEPGRALTAILTSSDWPTDVTVRWPEHETLDEPAMPPAWKNSSDALAACEILAARLPFAALAPATLVWKLAGLVMLASAGAQPYSRHAFTVSELPDLFEQVVVQLQDLPLAPTCYRPQADEPSLHSERRIRVLSGFSGAGKTAWASQAALHSSGVVAYFDAADAPGATFASSLVRELTGRLLGARGGALGEILLPGASGLEMLRLLDARLAGDAIDAIVIIDNAHHLSSDGLRSIMTATNHLRFALLGQPAAALREFCTLLTITEEHLAGWTTDTIAAAVADSGARADYVTCQRLLEITAGLPLYVQSAVRVATTDYNGDVARLCRDILTQTHVVAIAQEAILARVYNALSEEGRDMVAILSIAECPLTRDEAATLVNKTIGMSSTTLARLVREIAPRGLVQVFANDRLKVHDAVRLLGASRLHALGDSLLQSCRVVLRELLSASLKSTRDTSRIALFVQLLGLTGDIKTLVDLASDELFHEMGLAQDFRIVLEDAASNGHLPAEQRFWALDALVFVELKDGVGRKVEEWLSAMSSLLSAHDLGRDAQISLQMKQMLFAAKRGNTAVAMSLVRELLTSVHGTPSQLRVLRYNVACAMYFIKLFAPAAEIAERLIGDYYDHLGISAMDVLGKNPADIWPKLAKRDSVIDDLKHLADSLDLYAKCCAAIHVESGFARIHAFKFYNMASAYESALRVGQDVVDAFVRRHDYLGARRMLELTLLPLVHSAKILERVVPLRSQYAVVLAHCQEFAAAEAEMARLAPYESGLSAVAKQELTYQRGLIATLRRRTPRRNGAETALRGGPKIGRNAMCPCGSGKKHKRCHGAQD